MLKRLLIVLGILGFNGSVVAQKIDRAALNQAIHDIKPVPLKYQNQDGVWFSTTDAEKVLGLISDKLPKALDIIDAQDQEIASFKTTVNLYKATITSYNEYADYNKNMLDTALKYFPELRPPEYPWYEKPASTYVAGVITGIVVVTVSAYVLGNINTR